jgi:kanamycin nucleotidyltransferase
MDRSRRLDLAREIAAQIQDHYRDIRDVIVDDVLAIGVYGSLARGTDGPYSDIEMHCVVRGSGVDVCHEWSAGAWKAEVDVWALYDPTGFFSRLRDAALLHPDEVFQRVIRDVIVGEIYERIGKVRNARAANDDACLPFLAVELARCGACLLGLAHRHLYTTSTRMFEESLALPGRPEGYDILCRMVMAGDLADAARIADASDAFWSGVERWAGERGIQIEQDLERLLSLESKGGSGTIR